MTVMNQLISQTNPPALFPTEFCSYLAGLHNPGTLNGRQDFEHFNAVYNYVNDSYRNEGFFGLAY